MTFTRPPSLSGQLSPDSLPLTMQMLHQARRTCTVVLDTPGGPGELQYTDGALTHAAYRGLTGEAALPALLHSPSGQFAVYDGPPSGPVTITRAHDFVLMHAAVALDEQQQEASESDPDDFFTEDSALRPPPESIPHLSTDLRALTLTGDAWLVLCEIDGRLSIAQIAQHADLPLDQTRNILAYHAARGHLTYAAALLPDTFWPDVKAAATKALGPACVLLMRQAAAGLGQAPERIECQHGRAFLTTLEGLASENRRPLLRSHLHPLYAQYGL